MMTWGQIGIAVVQLARIKARRRLLAVRRNLFALRLWWARKREMRQGRNA